LTFQEYFVHFYGVSFPDRTTLNTANWVGEQGTANELLFHKFYEIY